MIGIRLNWLMTKWAKFAEVSQVLVKTNINNEISNNFYASHILSHV